MLKPGIVFTKIVGDSMKFVRLFFVVYIVDCTILVHNNSNCWK